MNYKMMNIDTNNQLYSNGILNWQDSQINDFEIGKTLGEGQFGLVKEAIHKPSGMKVAIKILEKSAISKSRHVERVKGEFKILQKIKHPNIAHLYH